jgi:hypothetical protein
MTMSPWSVLAAGVVATLIGWIWYHPKIFGATWMRLSHITPEMAERGKRHMPLYAFVAFIASIVAAYMMSSFGIAWGVYDWKSAMQFGLFAWIGFVVPPMLGIVLWEHKPLKLFFINALYWLVTLVAMALVLVIGA